MDYETIRAQFDLVQEIERDLGQALRRSGTWYFWRCPFHPDDSPSFGVNGATFHCFGCQKHGDVTDWLQEFRGMALTEIAQQAGQDTTEARLRRLEYQQREHTLQLVEQAQRLTALEHIHACTDHLRYHATMSEEGYLYWNQQGLLTHTIERYKLGYCPRCPTDDQARPSYTIPVMSNGKLWNIRHRLVDAPNGDKYRPHIAGLPNVLFNADTLRVPTPDILILEGEKKSMVATQAGFNNVAVMGKTGFDKAWVGKFSDFRRVNVCYDPDAFDAAASVARLFNGRGRVVSLPGKFDDLLTLHGAEPRDIQAFIDLGRKV